MVLYLQLDDHVWGIADFTDEDALGITGTIYSDRTLNTVFDLTGYTLTFRFRNNAGFLIEDDADNVEIVTAASGTWKYNPPDGRMNFEGSGQVTILLEKSGTQISAISINNSADLRVSQV